MRSKLTILLVAGILFTACQSQKQVPRDITVPELREHIHYLASDDLKGRYPGTDGSHKAIQYIRNEFTRAGLTLKGEEGFQSFQVTVAQKPGPGNALSIGDQKFTLGKDYTLMPFSGNGKVSGKVIFVGYGLQAEGKGRQWNDYARHDVKGHWVMMLRGAPRKEALRKRFMGQTKDREKALRAKDQGAAGVLFVSGPAYDPHDQLADPSLKKGNMEIPSLHIKREVADKILAPEQEQVKDLETKINETGQSLAFSLPTRVSA
ncbi:MAG TPA: PA domain-containing protein, partial [Bacteroidales bacterium]|nr:PA domain-containing protein [Bacteroidales bacterium]